MGHIIWVVLFDVGCYQMSNFSLNTDTVGFVIPGMVMGIGMAFVWSKLSVISFGTIDEKLSSDATGLFNLMRTMGGSIGVANLQLSSSKGASSLELFESIYR